MVVAEAEDPEAGTAGWTRRELGEEGERLAERYLTARGLRLIERNWRCREGEVDLVLDDAGTVVVCEVKTRTSRAFGDPVEAISRAKLARLRRLAARWLAEHPGGRRGVRIDVVGLLAHGDGTWSVTHLEGVG